MCRDQIDQPQAALPLQPELALLRQLIRHALSQGVDKSMILDAVFDTIHEQAIDKEVARNTLALIARVIQGDLGTDV